MKLPRAFARPYYILDDEHRPIEVTIEQWAQWMNGAYNDRSRWIGYTGIGEEIRISTVFLGIDHRFFAKGPPILFETMVFGGPLDQEQVRYVSWDDAEVGHKAMVRRVRAALAKVKNDQVQGGT